MAADPPDGAPQCSLFRRAWARRHVDAVPGGTGAPDGNSEGPMDLSTDNGHDVPGEHAVLAGPECACGRVHSGQQHLFNPDNYPAIAADIRQGLRPDPLYDALYGDREGDPTAPFDVAALLDKLAADGTPDDGTTNDFVFGTSLHQHDWHSAADDDIHNGASDDDI